jgi:hypothetical protein
MLDSIKFRQMKVLFSPDPKINYELHYEKYSSNYLSWFSRSNDLSDAADIIYREARQEMEEIKRKNSNEVQVIRKKLAVGIFPIYLMLKGYALETLLKGCCVLNKKGWDNRFKGHDLIILASHISLKFTTGEQKTLKHLTRFVEWGGRYPTPIGPAKYKEGGLDDGDIVGKKEFSINWIIENYEQFSAKVAELFFKVNEKITLILRVQREKEIFEGSLKNLKELIPRELIKWFAKRDKKVDAMSEKEKTTYRMFLYHAAYGKISKKVAGELGRTKLTKKEMESLSVRLKSFIREQGV